MAGEALRPTPLMKLAKEEMLAMPGKLVIFGSSTFKLSTTGVKETLSSLPFMFVIAEGSETDK